jgi:serine/threonine protein kinase
MLLLTIRQVDLFPAEAPGNIKRPQRRIAYNLPDERTQDGSDRLSNDWTESERYHKVCKIGQGAFATVYKVTDKFHGVPYAAKELDKRKFMKNGVLDQKVENELNIMQRIKHVSTPDSCCALPLLMDDSRILSDT